MEGNTQSAQAIALKLAVALAGSYKKLADICGCSKQNLHRADTSGSGLPAKYSVNVEKRLGLSRHITRPDVFGPWQEKFQEFLRGVIPAPITEDDLPY